LGDAGRGRRWPRPDAPGTLGLAGDGGSAGTVLVLGHIRGGLRARRADRGGGGGPWRGAWERGRGWGGAGGGGDTPAPKGGGGAREGRRERVRPGSSRGSR